MEQPPPNLWPSGRALEVDQLRLCRDSFVYFCETYCKVEDKETHRAIPFVLYPAQRRVGEMLVNGDWLWILKARRLGLTWLLVAYAAWLLTFRENRTVAVINQDKVYAQEFVDRVRFILDRLPREMQHIRGKNNARELQLVTSGGYIQSFAPTKNAGHGKAVDLFIIDEASRVKLLREILNAAEPTLETALGSQLVALSTSNGPQGRFYEVWQDASSPARRSRYTPVFLNWRDRPGRTEEWYGAEAAAHESDPLYMKQQYPSSAEEAFESAEGRVYPLFVRSDKFIRSIELQPSWERYRAVDWGGTDPFICLWGTVIPGDGPGLTVDPACRNTINELLAYSYEKGKPQEHGNHACDALRYLVVTPGNNGIKGHLHIYREIYEPNSAARGFGVDDMARRIITMTGAESIKLTVADVSRPDNIRTFHNMGLKPVQGYRKLGGDRGTEIEQGITQLNALIVAWSKSKAVAIPAEQYSRLPAGFNPTQIQSAAVQKRPPIFG